MKVEVLDEATTDLADGFRFYERQSEGLGTILWIHCGPTFSL